MLTAQTLMEETAGMAVMVLLATWSGLKAPAWLLTSSENFLFEKTKRRRARSDRSRQPILQQPDSSSSKQEVPLFLLHKAIAAFSCGILLAAGYLHIFPSRSSSAIINAVFSNRNRHVQNITNSSALTAPAFSRDVTMILVLVAVFLSHLVDSLASRQAKDLRAKIKNEESQGQEKGEARQNDTFQSGSHGRLQEQLPSEEGSRQNYGSFSHKEKPANSANVKVEEGAESNTDGPRLRHYALMAKVILLLSGLTLLSFSLGVDWAFRLSYGSFSPSTSASSDHSTAALCRLVLMTSLQQFFLASSFSSGVAVFREKFYSSSRSEESIGGQEQEKRRTQRLQVGAEGYSDGKEQGNKDKGHKLLAICQAVLVLIAPIGLFFGLFLATNVGHAHPPQDTNNGFTRFISGATQRAILPLTNVCSAVAGGILIHTAVVDILSRYIGGDKALTMKCPLERQFIVFASLFAGAGLMVAIVFALS